MGSSKAEGKESKKKSKPKDGEKKDSKKAASSGAKKDERREAAAAAAGLAAKKRKDGKDGESEKKEPAPAKKKLKKKADKAKEPAEDPEIPVSIEEDPRRHVGGAADAVALGEAIAAQAAAGAEAAAAPAPAKRKSAPPCAAEALDALDALDSADEGAAQAAKATEEKEKPSLPPPTTEPAVIQELDKLMEDSVVPASEDAGKATASRSRDRDRRRQGKDKEKSRDRRRKASSSASPGSYDEADSSESGRRQKRRADAGLKPAMGFGLAPPPPAPEAATFGPSPDPASQQLVMPETVKGLLVQPGSLAQEMMQLKMAVQAATGQSIKLEPKEEAAETTLKMPGKLTDSLLDPENLARLLKRTGLFSATLNAERHVVLRAPGQKALQKVLGQLRRVAWHCQWGCSIGKVGALLSEKPAKPASSVVVRLAATSSRLLSHDERLNVKNRKLRIGTDSKACQLSLEHIAGVSRKHCTITFEPEKGCCYIQDTSTNGTYLNGKRLPRPPYKNPSDARVRLFHGDELYFKMRGDDAEELGYVINLLELS